MNQTTLTDADRAILSRLTLPALRNESRGDDRTDYLGAVMNPLTPHPYFEYVKGEPRRDSQRPRDPKPGMQPDQVAHAEFILSTRETALTLEG